ncbi:TonB-dependent receptor [Massilia aurea]|uniref:TonB-dependent receptor domain-containing protein n=1 Tax=Massilia aurea TaxID=373040 RepID=UPI003462A1C7
MNFPVSRQAAAVSLALAIISSTAIAQVADTVVVTATRTPQRAADVIADTTVINAEEIARSGAGSVADILQRQRGIEIARNGPAGTATSVFVRGANANQVVVLLDGVRVGSATTGTASWNAVPLGAIDRIEIVYGPLSTLYGADAIGGVIQIFTRKGEGAPVVTGSVGAGSNATLQGDAGIFGSSGGPNAISYAFGAGYEESDGFSSTRPGASGYNADEDGYRRRNANGRVAMAIAPGHEIGAQFLASRTYSQYDASNSGSYDVHTDSDLNTAAVFMTNQILPNWRSTVQYARSEDKSGSFSNATPSGASQIDTEQNEFSWQNNVAIGQDTLQLLFNHRKEEVSSMRQTRITNSYAAAYSAKRGAHLVDVSARQDRSVYGSQNTGAAGYGYDFGNGLRATASIGSSFRAPTFNELYFPGYGLPTNKPEKGRNREVGLRYDGNGYNLDATYFNNRLTDMIVSSTPCPNGTRSCAYNVNEATLEGFSLAGSTRVMDVNLRASLDWQDPRDDTTGRQLARRAKQHANFAADYTLGQFKSGAELTVSGDRFDNATNTTRLAGYGLLNLYTTYQFTPDWSLLLRLNNVADKNYEVARNYGTSGRTWFASLRYGIR